MRRLTYALFIVVLPAEAMAFERSRLLDILEETCALKSGKCVHTSDLGCLKRDPPRFVYNPQTNRCDPAPSATAQLPLKRVHATEPNPMPGFTPSSPGGVNKEIRAGTRESDLVVKRLHKNLPSASEFSKHAIAAPAGQDVDVDEILKRLKASPSSTMLER